MKVRHIRITTAALFSVAIVSLMACDGADARRASHLERGREYFAAEQYEKARVEVQNALQIAPSDPDARTMAGRIAEQLGDIRGAIGQYQGALDVVPDHAEAGANLGRINVFGGAPERALEIIAAPLKTHAADPELLVVRAAARAQMNDRPRALEDASRAHAIAPDNESAIALLVSLYRQGGDGAKAMALLDRSLKRLPKSVDLLQIAATMHAEARETDAAVGQLRRIIELRPDRLAYRTQLAIYLARLKRVDEAEDVLRQAVDRDPKDTAAVLAYVDLVTALRSSPRGIEALGNFIKRDPENLELQLGLGMLQQRSGALRDAMRTYRRVIESNGVGPKGLTARNRIAAIEASAGRFDGAAKLIAEVLAQNRNDNDALVLRGNISLQRGDAAGAIADLRSVLRDQPNSGPLLRTLARAHLANSEPALAEECLRTALGAAPSNREIRVDLAQLLVQNGRVEQGVSLLEEAVKDSPDDVPAREALVRAYIARRDFDAARNAAEDLQVLAPDKAIGFHLAGMVAHEQKRPNDAIRDFSRALELQPDAVDTLAGLVRIDVERQAPDGALERVQAFVRRQGESAPALNLLGELQVSRREYGAAIITLGRAVAKAPDWWMPHRNLALTHFGAGDSAKGIRTLELAAGATGFALPIVSDLGAAYERSGRAEDAIRLYEELYRRNPRLEIAANNLAMLLVTHRKDQASLDRARDISAVFANASSAPYLDTYGWVRLRRGEVAQALPALERAAQLSPESRVIRFHLGMAQKSAGQTERARATLEAAVRDAQPFAGLEEARVALQQLVQRLGTAG